MTTTPHTTRQTEALALHRRGRVPAEIAASMGISYTRARSILIRMGVTPHHTPRRWPESPRRMSLAEHNEARSHIVATRRARIIKLLRGCPSMTSAAIAAACSVSTATIQYDRRAIGLPAPKPGR
jgi:hypothetical protein